MRRVGFFVSVVGNLDYVRVGKLVVWVVLVVWFVVLIFGECGGMVLFFLVCWCVNFVCYRLGFWLVECYGLVVVLVYLGGLVYV